MTGLRTINPIRTVGHAEARALKGRAGPICAIAAFGFAVRAWLIQSFPMMHGSDSITRLFDRNRILIAHQLPAWQASIVLLSRASSNPVVSRYWTAIVASIAGIGFYLLARDVMSKRPAFWAALFFAANPFLVSYSIVPYQEMLMLAGLLFAFHFLFTRRYMLSSLCLGLACFTRYEAWAACPVFAAFYVFDQNRPVEWNARLLGFLKSCFLFGWAPLAWIVFSRGFAPSGAFVLETTASPARLMRYPYLAWVTANNMPLPVLGLAILGLWGMAEIDSVKRQRLAVLGGFVGTFLATIFFSAHGDQRDWDRFVTAREAHIPIAAATLLAGLGLAYLQSRLQQSRIPQSWPSFLVPCLAVVGVGLGVLGAYGFVARETADPEVVLSHEVARFLDRSVGDNDRALILAKPVAKQGFVETLERASKRGGEAGRRAAERMLETVDASPPAYQRIVVESRLRRDRLIFKPPVGSVPRWVVLWSDFQPASAGEEEACRLAQLSGSPAQSYRAGVLEVQIYRLGTGEEQH